MAVAFDGFSIREYTAKMRSVDVAKCWPFSEKAVATKTSEQVEALLPPITVAKFKWWSHELRRLRSTRRLEDEKSSDEKLEMVCPVCRVFTSATVNAVNAHIDECLSGNYSFQPPPPSTTTTKEARRQIVRNNNCKALKPKSKPPKKRSITEIFAVAPQIETIESSEMSDKEGDEVEDEDLEREEVVADDDSQVISSVSKSSSSIISCSSTGPLMKAKNKKKKKNNAMKKISKENNNNNKKKKKKRVLLIEKESGMASSLVLKKLKEKKKFKKVLKKMKNVDLSNSFATNNKGNVQKFKLQNHVIAKRLKRKFSTDISNSDSVWGNKTSPKCLATLEKQKCFDPPKLIARNQEPALPIRSILKNHTTCEPKSTTVDEDFQCGSEANPCGILQSERHVRFSDKEDILGPKSKEVCSSEQNDRNSLSDALAASSEDVQSSDNKSAAVEIERSDVDSTFGTDFGSEVRSIFGGKQLVDIHHADLPSSPRLPVTIRDKMNLFPEKSSLPLSQCAFYGTNLHMVGQDFENKNLKHGFSGTPGLFSPLEGSHGSTQATGNVSRIFNSCGRSNYHFPDPTHKVAEIMPMIETRPFSEPSSSFTANENLSRRLQFQSQPAVENARCHTLCYQQLCRRRPMDLVGGFCSFPEWNHRAVTSRERTREEDFFGLPLNSQGELIQSNSRGKGLYNQLRETNFAGPSSSFSASHNLTQPRITADYLSVTNKHSVERDLPNDRVNLFLTQNYVKENSSLQVPATRLGVSYWESSGKADIQQLDFGRVSNHSFRPLDADLKLMGTSFLGSRHYDHLQNQIINERIQQKESSGKTAQNTSQPTMRLMGKDVAIGRSSTEMQVKDDSNKVWTDKEIIVEHCPSVAGLDCSSLKRNFQEWIPQKCKENVGRSLDLHSEKSTQTNLPMKATESSSYPYLDREKSSLISSDSLATDRSPSATSLPFSRLPHSSSVFNREPNLQDFFISGTESRLVSQHPVLSTPQNSWQYMDWRPAELNHHQTLPHFTKPGFEFPFLNPDSRVDVQSSWFQNSKSLPSWLLPARQHGNTSMIASQLIPNAISKQHQHISSRTSFLNTPSVYHSGEACSFSCNPGGDSHFQVRSSFDSADAVALPSTVPVIPGLKPTSVIDAGYRNRLKIKERLKPKALGVKDLYPYKKTNKRLHTKLHDLVKSKEILNSKKQANSSVMARCLENSNNERQSDMVEEFLHSNRYYSSEFCSSGIKISANDCPSADGSGRPGPMKLSAGAKHILKPNQNVDPENFTPVVHSTIPFTAVPNPNANKERVECAAHISDHMGL
ncbi:uncharacterized protein LOC115698858 isoform X1 [Cannabis sativa]|uniref:uncharacterized protein LOC115698858 isoform X1 n=1 Tax=Cannabis sativa TaxID=3483 RepID=UPI0029CA675C|nr:uncharacterized protein LOC115698858 isoform X1 [Cannabis sativa]